VYARFIIGYICAALLEINFYMSSCKGFQATSLAHTVILLTCVQEVHGLIAGWDTEFLTEIFLSFT